MELSEGAACPSDGLPEGLFVGIGNPLLDISATVGDDMLTKYGLNPNDAIMAEEKHMPLYKELTEQYKARFIAGGSVQNTLRMVQWILKKPKVCTYFGCVGDDDFAKILGTKAEANGVHVMYQVNKEVPTGTCAVLLTSGGTRRSLCANLGAAQKFTVDHFDKPECKQIIDNAKMFYTSGFFIAVSQEAVMKLAKQALAKNLIFALNISAPFVVDNFEPQLRELLPYVDFLFGNIHETTVFAKAFNIKTDDTREMARTIAELPKLNKLRSRVVVVTQSEDPVIVAEKGEILEVPVTPLKKEDIVDTNGAGDAFTGGFLSQLLLNKSLKQCVQCGMYSARCLIQISGFSLSGESNFQPEP